jgi:hypothetical protein
MATFWESLSESSKKRWAGTEEGNEKVVGIYEQFTGRKWVPPAKDKRAIHCETKIEDTAEIADLMKQKPNYPLDVQGREG